MKNIYVIDIKMYAYTCSDGPFWFWYKFVEINLTCVIVVETLRYLNK